MKRLHRADLFGWSCFDESRNLDFHSVLWVHAGGNVAIDPLPLSPHDRAHEGGRLTTLPAPKLGDPARAAASVRRLAALPGIDAVLVGVGWPIFRGGGAALRELAERL